MSISSYDKNGITLWKVAVKIRSKMDRTVSLQKEKRGLSSETEAKQWEKKLQEQGIWELARKENQGASWSQLVDSWEQFLMQGDAITEPVEPSTVQDYVGSVRKHTVDWMDRPATSIGTADVRFLLNQLSLQAKNPVTIRKIKGFISTAYKWAIETGWDATIKVNPTLGIRMDRTHRSKRTEILSLVEIKKLLADAHTLNNEWYPVWAMAVMTGMRSGELYALQWPDIDWENRRISVNKSFSKRAKYRNPVAYPDGMKCPKSGETREIPINDELLGFLKEAKVKAGSSPFVLPRITAWTYGDQAQYLKGFCQGIGIRPICFHSLRACFATQLLQRGVAPVVVMAIAGWKDMKTMMRYIRMAGVDIQEGTAPLKVLSPKEGLANVYYLNRSE